MGSVAVSGAVEEFPGFQAESLRKDTRRRNVPGTEWNTDQAWAIGLFAIDQDDVGNLHHPGPRVDLQAPFQRYPVAEGWSRSTSTKS